MCKLGIHHVENNITYSAVTKQEKVIKFNRPTYLIFKHLHDDRVNIIISFWPESQVELPHGAVIFVKSR